MGIEAGFGGTEFPSSHELAGFTMAELMYYHVGQGKPFDPTKEAHKRAVTVEVLENMLKFVHKAVELQGGKNGKPFYLNTAKEYGKACLPVQGRHSEEPGLQTPCIESKGDCKCEAQLKLTEDQVNMHI